MQGRHGCGGQRMSAPAPAGSIDFNEHTRASPALVAKVRREIDQLRATDNDEPARPAQEPK